MRTFEEIMSYSAMNKEYFEALKYQVASSMVTPFIGSGMSAPIYPLWEETLLELAELVDLTTKNTVNNMLGEEYIKEHPFAYEETAQLLVNKIGKNTVMDRLKTIFDPRKIEDYDIKSMAIFIIPFLFNNGLLLTTNYDHLIEKVYSNAKNSLRAYDIFHPEIITRCLREAGVNPSLIQLHGDVEEMESTAIINSDSYAKAYNPNGELVKCLKACFETKCVLFLGNSLHRDRTMDVLKQTKKEGARHFTIFPCCDDDTTKMEKNKELSDKGIRAILYPDGEHDCVKTILEKLLSESFPDKHQQYISFIETENNNKKDLYIFLNSKLEKTRNEHPSFCLMKIQQELFPHANLEIKASYLNPSQKYAEDFTLSEIIHNSWKSKTQNHLMLEGEGGIGKTVFLLSFATDKKINPRCIPTIYIPLNKLKYCSDNDSIIKYINKSVLNNNSELLNILNAETDRPWEDGPNVLLLLDGFNEIAPEDISAASRDIEKWSEKPGVQIVTASRFDVRSYLLNISGEYRSVRLLPLSKEIIKKYLVSTDITPPKHNSNIWKIIDFPLMLMLYSSSKHVQDTHPSKILSWYSLDDKKANSSAIIWNYLQSEIWRCQSIASNDKTVVCASIALEFIAPAIAWKMVKLNKFSIDEKDFYSEIESTISSLHAKNPRDLSVPLQKIIRNLYIQDTDEIKEREIFDLLTNNLNMFRIIINDNHTQSISLMHQNFRDFLAALHLLNIGTNSKNKNDLPNEWKEPFDQYVLNYLSELIKIDENNYNIWNQMWKKSANENLKKSIESHFIAKMLSVYKSAFGPDISKLNFSNMDLTHVLLSGYKLVNAPKKNFQNTIISKSTFYAMGHQGAVSGVTWSPKGDYFISSSYDCSLRIWNNDNNINELVTEDMAAHYIRCVAWHPKEDVFVSSGDDMYIIQWKYDQDSLSWKSENLGKCNDWTYCMQWNDDGSILLCGDRSGNLVTISNTGEIIRYENYHSGVVLCVSWENDLFASASEDGTICVWKQSIRTPFAKIVLSNKEKIISVSWIGNKNYLLAATSSRLYLLNVSSLFELGVKNQIKTEYLNDEIITNIFECQNLNQVVVSHLTNKDIIAVFSNDQIEIIDGVLNKGEYSWYSVANVNTKQLEMGRIMSADWNSNSNQIVCGSRNGSVWRVNYIEGNSESTRLLVDNVGYETSKAARSSSWRKSDGKLAVGYDDCKIRIWDTKNYTCVNVFEGHKDSIKCLSWSPDGRYLVSGSDDSTLKIWDVDNENKKPLTSNMHTGPINCVLWLKSNTIISGSDDGTLCILNPKTMESEVLPKEHTKRIYSISASEDDALLVSGGNDDYICIWNLQKKELIAKQKSGHHEPIRAVAFDRNANGIFSASNDCTIRYRALNTLDNYNESIEAFPQVHTDFIYDLVLSNDGNTIVTGSSDKTVGFWDKTKNKLIKRIPTGSFVWNVNSSYELDGRYLVNSSNESNIIIWDITKAKSENIINKVAEIETIPNINILRCDFSNAKLIDKDLDKLIKTNGGRV